MAALRALLAACEATHENVLEGSREFKHGFEIWFLLLEIIHQQHANCDLHMDGGMVLHPPRPVWCEGWVCPRGSGAPWVMFGLLRYNERAAAQLLGERVAALQP